jgi:two-component system response regulator ResD
VVSGKDPVIESVEGAQPDERRVLVVDDDPNVADVVTRYLVKDGFVVRSAADGPSALDEAVTFHPDLIVLDLMLPGIDGLEVFRRLRERGSTPIIMLTAKGDESDRINGLELGADDYVSKPFSPRELVLRVKSVLRRSAPESSGNGEVLEAGKIKLDPDAREVTVNGEPVTLTTLEFELLRFLMSSSRRAFSREEMLSEVWGYSFGDTSTVTVHIRRLREKIEQTPAEPTHLVTVWGVGYRFDP